MKNLVVSELLLTFAALFEHRISEQKCDIPLYYANSIGDFCFQSFPMFARLERILIPQISWVLKIQYFDKIIYNYIQYFIKNIYWLEMILPPITLNY